MYLNNASTILNPFQLFTLGKSFSSVYLLLFFLISLYLKFWNCHYGQKTHSKQNIKADCSKIAYISLNRVNISLLALYLTTLLYPTLRPLDISPGGVPDHSTISNPLTPRHPSWRCIWPLYYIQPSDPQTSILAVYLTTLLYPTLWPPDIHPGGVSDHSTISNPLTSRHPFWRCIWPLYYIQPSDPQTSILAVYLTTLLYPTLWPPDIHSGGVSDHSTISNPLTPRHLSWWCTWPLHYIQPSDPQTSLLAVHLTTLLYPTLWPPDIHPDGVPDHSTISNSLTPRHPFWQWIWPLYYIEPSDPQTSILTVYLTTPLYPTLWPPDISPGGAPDHSTISNPLTPRHPSWRCTWPLYYIQLSDPQTSILMVYLTTLLWPTLWPPDISSGGVPDHSTISNPLTPRHLSWRCIWPLYWASPQWAPWCPCLSSSSIIARPARKLAGGHRSWSFSSRESPLHSAKWINMSLKISLAPARMETGEKLTLLPSCSYRKSISHTYLPLIIAVLQQEQVSGSNSPQWAHVLFLWLG